MGFRIFVTLLIAFGVLLAGMEASTVKGPVAVATVSHRVAKPGQPIELLITIRNARAPVSAGIECPAGLELKRFWKPQQLRESDTYVWLLRYRLLATVAGDYEIPPIRVSAGTQSAVTKPVILHVSNDLKPPLPDARELALTTDIPMGLALEAMKACPTPAPRPTPAPVQKDQRPYFARLLSAIGNGFRWFWNYPGK